jgi:hypothetical protein
MTPRIGMTSAVLLIAVAAGCARPIIPQVAVGDTPREINAPCDPANATLQGDVRRIELEPLVFQVPARWVPDYATLNNVGFNLLKTNSDLQVWKGGEFTFTPVVPRNTVQCEVTKGDTTITIRTTVLTQGITSYRVDVTWAPLIDGQHLYMQMQTRFPEHLRDIRGVIESVGVVPRKTAVKP